ncbi:PepSY domain-containing protein [Sulfuriflexus mobilis]|uniref:PepSY domain-containing protein n=1 Tax=Sulfuriflexus mobilis TaxID=1811807 RepID=UPI000F84DE6B|nr:PepSY domain-containing protein [Sulfuriflexus mobilis]
MKTLLASVFLLWALGAQTVQAERPTTTRPAISSNEAAARVQRQYGGRILAVETLQHNGQVFYRIKLLTRQGVVRVVRVDAGSRR